MMWVVCISDRPCEILKEGTTIPQATRHRKVKQAEIDKARSGGGSYSNSGFVTTYEVPVVEPREVF